MQSFFTKNSICTMLQKLVQLFLLYYISVVHGFKIWVNTNLDSKKLCKLTLTRLAKSFQQLVLCPPFTWRCLHCNLWAPSLQSGGRNRLKKKLGMKADFKVETNYLPENHTHVQLQSVYSPWYTFITWGG